MYTSIRAYAHGGEEGDVQLERGLDLQSRTINKKLASTETPLSSHNQVRQLRVIKLLRDQKRLTTSAPLCDCQEVRKELPCSGPVSTHQYRFQSPRLDNQEKLCDGPDVRQETNTSGPDHQPINVGFPVFTQTTLRSCGPVHQPINVPTAV